MKSPEDYYQKKTDAQLWADYVDKMRIAQETLDIKDGLAARRAWVAFMEATDYG